MKTLTGKIAVVTGASRGAGRGIAGVLGEFGATVYVTGRSVRGATATENLPGTIEDTAEEVTARGGRGIAVRCDHTDEAQVAALFEQVKKEQGRLDLLVNNAWGGYERYDEAGFEKPFWEQPFWRWEGMVTAGVRAHLLASRYAALLFIEQKSGLIINTTAWDNNKYLGNLIYDVAKNAVNRLAWGMARELRPYNVATIALAPGFMRTERVLTYPIPDVMTATESPEYVGRAIVALANDPQLMQKSGGTFMVGELAQEYNFVDIDGRQVAPFYLPEELR